MKPSFTFFWLAQVWKSVVNLPEEREGKQGSFLSGAYFSSQVGPSQFPKIENRESRYFKRIKINSLQYKMDVVTIILGQKSYFVTVLPLNVLPGHKESLSHCRGPTASFFVLFSL